MSFNEFDNVNLSEQDKYYLLQKNKSSNIKWNINMNSIYDNLNGIPNKHENSDELFVTLKMLNTCLNKKNKKKIFSKQKIKSDEHSLKLYYAEWKQASSILDR